MKLAKYWTRSAGIRGWSNDSMEAARAVARDIAQRHAQGNFPTRGRQYLYGDRPLPEPVLREFQSAVVTRNVYGAEVLNTRELMFVDIDKAPLPLAKVGFHLRSLFGKSAPASPDDAEMSLIQSVAERNNLAGRVYKTAGGYRVLITSAAFTPGDTLTEDLLRQFDADPLYIRLCRMQESFRARLTPKPWRCGLHTPPVDFPYETPQDQSRFDAWEQAYKVTGERYATCRYMASFGSSGGVLGFEELVRYHDLETKADSSLPLA